MDLNVCDGDLNSKRGIYRGGCDVGEICARYDHNPQDGTVVFDDIWNSLNSSFRIMFRDNWMVVSWAVQDGVNKSSWIPIYCLLFLSTFALTSLFPGAMMVNLQTILRHEANEVNQGRISHVQSQSIFMNRLTRCLCRQSATRNERPPELTTMTRMPTLKKP